MTRIALAESEAEIARCFPVMAELRGALADAAQFTAQVKRQMKDGGYRLVFLEDEGEIAAVAGFRVSEWLARGKAMLVDDLVTASAVRSRGHGGRLMDWLTARARAESCRELHLDSGPERDAAHRFYRRQGLEISAYHFRRRLD